MKLSSYSKRYLTFLLNMKGFLHLLLLFGSGALGASVVGPDCPPGWSQFESKCYKIIEEKKSWDEAQTICQKEGANLASINSSSANKFVEDLIVKTPVEYPWIGAYLFSSELKEFKWIDGTPFVFDNWDKDQPLYNPAESCVEIVNGKWHDFTCGFQRAFICQKTYGELAVTGEVAVAIRKDDKLPYNNSGICPCDWIQFGNHCYRYFENKTTWSDALDRCNKEGGNLASIHSQDENTFVHQLSFCTEEDFWIGSDDHDKDRSWVWTDGSAWTFAAWARVEHTGDWWLQHCGHMFALNGTLGGRNFSGGEWHIVTCDRLYNFVCEQPISTTPVPSFCPSSPSLCLPTTTQTASSISPTTNATTTTTTTKTTKTTTITTNTKTSTTTTSTITTTTTATTTNFTTTAATSTIKTQNVCNFDYTRLCALRVNYQCGRSKDILTYDQELFTSENLLETNFQNGKYIARTDGEYSVHFWTKGFTSPEGGELLLFHNDKRINWNERNTTFDQYNAVVSLSSGDSLHIVDNCWSKEVNTLLNSVFCVEQIFTPITKETIIPPTTTSTAITAIASAAPTTTKLLATTTYRDSYLYISEKRILKLPSLEDVTCKQDFQPDRLILGSAAVVNYNNQQELMVCGGYGMTGCSVWTKNGWMKTAASFPRSTGGSSMTASGAWLWTGGWDTQTNKVLKSTKLYTKSGWQDFTELPRATYSHCQVFGENKRVYVIGGRTNGYITTDTTYELTSSNKWVKLSSLNTPRSRHLCVEWEGGILAIGGQGVKYGVTLSSVEKFNPLKNKWLPFTALPIPLFGGQTFNWEGDVFVLGGWTPGKSKSVHNNEVFKLKKGSQTWEVVPGVGISHGNRKIYPAVIIKNLHCNN